jgi:hypothetical protein
MKTEEAEDNKITFPLRPEDIKVTPAKSRRLLHYSYLNYGGNPGNIRYKKYVLGINV